MAYQVLARKYRPQRFSDVAGQDHVTVTLMNAVSQGRIAHGYIFSGHRGIGKTTVARILAMALNCRTAIGTEQRPTAEPCELCESCMEIRAGNSVDVIEIDAATNRGIDEIRELRDAARYRPARDRYKVYILDEAHQITDAAFNALLKTLEEPPDHIVFMMATTQPEDVPQTVRSRCQHFSFHAVKMVDILRELQDIARREGVDADEGALSLLAEAGDGSMRDALSVMDQAIASAPIEGDRPRLDATQIRELMGSVSNAIFEHLLEAVDSGRSAEVLTTANEMLDTGNSAAQVARQAVRYIRNCLMAKISGVTPEGVSTDGGPAEILQISTDERRRVGRTAALFTEEELTRFLQVMLRTFDELGYRQEPRFHLELGLLKLVHLRRLLPMEEVLSALPTAGAAYQRPARERSPTEVSSRSATAPPESSAFQTTAARLSSSREQVLSTAHNPAAESSPRRSDATVTGSPNWGTSSNPPLSTSAPPKAMTAEAARTSDSAASSTVVSIPLMSAVEQEDKPAAAVILEHVRAVASPHQQISDAPEVAPPLTEQSAPPKPGSVEAIQEAVVQALFAVKGQTSAAEALSDASWSTGADTIRVETTLSKRMLATVVNAEAERLARNALQLAAPGFRMELVAGAAVRAPGSGPKKPALGRSGSAQARALEHPVVQEAQRLFGAEIRTIIDLSDSGS